MKLRFCKLSHILRNLLVGLIHIVNLLLQTGFYLFRQSSSETPPGRTSSMKQIIYIVGLIVIVIFILGFFGLR